MFNETPIHWKTQLAALKIGHSRESNSIVKQFEKDVFIIFVLQIVAITMFVINTVLKLTMDYDNLSLSIVIITLLLLSILKLVYIYIDNPLYRTSKHCGKKSCYGILTKVVRRCQKNTDTQQEQIYFKDNANDHITNYMKNINDTNKKNYHSSNGSNNSGGDDDEFEIIKLNHTTKNSNVGNDNLPSYLLSILQEEILGLHEQIPPLSRSTINQLIYTFPTTNEFGKYSNTHDYNDNKIGTIDSTQSEPLLLENQVLKQRTQSTKISKNIQSIPCATLTQKENPKHGSYPLIKTMHNTEITDRIKNILARQPACLLSDDTNQEQLLMESYSSGSNDSFPITTALNNQQRIKESQIDV